MLALIFLVFLIAAEGKDQGGSLSPIVAQNFRLFRMLSNISSSEIPFRHSAHKFSNLGFISNLNRAISATLLLHFWYGVTLCVTLGKPEIITWRF